MKTHDGRKPVAVTDKQTYQLLLRTGKVGGQAFMAGMRLTLSRVAEAQQGAGLVLLCPEFCPERPLELLERRVAEYDASIKIPRLEDPDCVVLPSNLTDLCEVVDRFEAVIVLGSGGLITAVDPAGKPAVEIV